MDGGTDQGREEMPCECSSDQGAPAEEAEHETESSRGKSSTDELTKEVCLLHWGMEQDGQTNWKGEDRMIMWMTYGYRPKTDGCSWVLLIKDVPPVRCFWKNGNGERENSCSK